MAHRARGPRGNGAECLQDRAWRPQRIVRPVLAESPELHHPRPQRRPGQGSLVCAKEARIAACIAAPSVGPPRSPIDAGSRIRPQGGPKLGPDCGRQPAAPGAQIDGRRRLLFRIPASVAYTDVVVHARRQRVLRHAGAAQSPSQARASQHCSAAQPAHADQLAGALLEVCRHWQHAAEAAGAL